MRRETTEPHPWDADAEGRITLNVVEPHREDPPDLVRATVQGTAAGIDRLGKKCAGSLVGLREAAGSAVSQKGPSPHMAWLPALAVVALIVGLTRALPQLVRLLRAKDAAGVSVDGCATSATVSSFWAVYGVLTGQPAVVFASATPAFIFVLIILAALRYGRSVRELRSAPVFLVAFGAAVLAGGAGALGVALTAGALVANTPHVVVAYREKDLSGISPSTWTLTAADGAIWLTYALVTGDVPILVNNFFQLTTSLLVVGRQWSWARSRPTAAPATPAYEATSP